MTATYSIVIPTAGNYQQLLACLDTIVQASDLNKTEIIVVNNGDCGENSPTVRVCNAFKAKLGDAFKYIQLAENQGFCVGTNMGMKMASGKYIVWLNDDTLVLPGWLESLRSSIDLPHLYHRKVGLAGPLSNRVAGDQCVTELASIQPQDIQKAISHVENVRHKYRVTAPDGQVINYERLTGFLSGFCLMFKREVMEEIGFIDEQFSPGGFCDNDYVLRAINAGWGAVLSQQTFVWHAGSQTLNRLFPEMAGGVKNWAKFIAKYREDKPNKLVMLQRVKIDNNEQLATFKKCAYRNRDLVDGVFILSDKSEHNEFTEKMCKNIFGSKLLGFSSNKKSAPLDEIRDRMFLLNQAHNSDFDWVVVMDHDECFGEGTERSRLDELMNPINPQVNGYTFLFNNYWRGSELARIDGPWGSAFFSRMYRNKKFTPVLRPPVEPDDPGLHCGNRPLSIPENMFTMCDITIDHYGYSNGEEIERKYKLYNELDKTPEELQQYTVGSTNYNHLINEIGIQVVVPRPFSISVNLMVKNEEATIGQQILRYASIAREFVICDTGSTDSTMQQLDLAKIPYFQKPIDDNFAAVRNELIKRSKYKYIMHVDADEIPEPSILHKIVLMLNTGPDVCLQGLKTQHRDGRYQVIKQPRIFKNDGRFYYFGRIHETLDESVSKAKNLTHGDADVVIFNPGLLKDPDRIKQKLEYYGRLLELELKDHPNNYKACFELALHYRNYGRLDEAVELLKKCAKNKPEFLRAKFELALIEANKALDWMETCQGYPGEPDLLEAMKVLHQGLAPFKYTPVSLE